MVISRYAITGQVVRVISRSHQGLSLGKKVANEFPGHLAGTTGRIVKQNRGFIRLTAPHHPHIRQGCVLAAGFLEHLDSRFVHRDDRPGTNFVAQQLNQWFDGPAHERRPVTQRRPRDVYAQARELGLLAIERQRIDELGDEDIGQQPGSDYALGDDLRGQSRQPDRAACSLGLALDAFAAAAGVFVADVALDLNARWHDLELLADFFADPGQRAAAHAGFFSLWQIVNDVLARQISRKRPTARLLALVRGHNHDRLFLGRLDFRFSGVGFIKERVLILLDALN